MRTVISHFFNEEYLLPWWLQHHVPMFDYGVMINHGSTDDSIDIIRQHAPHWRIVNSRLTEFDAALTDLEVSNVESELPPSWKLVLNVTEFLMTAKSLDDVERELLDRGRGGCACSGMVIVDESPENHPDPARPLVLQKHFGIDDNCVRDLTPADRQHRQSLGLDQHVLRNRFYHSHAIGMYGPGRHNSTNPDYHFRNPDMFIFYYAFAPWNDDGISRKTQIASKIKAADLARGWGTHHTFSKENWQAQFDKIRLNSYDLSTLPPIRSAMDLIEAVTQMPAETARLSPRSQEHDYARLLHEEQLHRTDLQRQIASLQPQLIGNIGSKQLVTTLGQRLLAKLKHRR